MPFPQSEGLITKRQAVSPECYSVADLVGMVWQSEGDVTSLCYAEGDFSVAFAALQSCISANTGNGSAILSSLPELVTPLSFCESVKASLASVYGINTGAVTTVATTIFNNSTSSTSLVASSSTPSNTASRVSDTSSATSSPTSNALSTGAKAGIAIGAIVACGIIFALLGVFILRQRRRKKQRLAADADAAATAALLEAKSDKAQLHADEYKPPREELAGSEGKRRVREIDGLHEVEYRHIRDARGEMAANEVAAPEVLGSKAYPVEVDRN